MLYNYNKLNRLFLIVNKTNQVIKNKVFFIL